MTRIYHAWPYGRFIEIKSNLRGKKIHTTILRSNFLGGSFSNRDNVRAPIKFKREGQPQHLKRLFFLKNRPIHFRINSTSVIRPIKQNQLSFFSIEINKQLPVPVHSVSQIRFKVKSQFQLLPQIRCLILFTVESSIIRIDSNIMDNITKKVIKVYIVGKVQYQEWTKDEYSCEDFLCKNTQSHLLLRKEEIRPNI